MCVYDFLISRKGAYLILFLLFMGTIGRLLITNKIENPGDIGMYIAISQAMDSGSILYKDVVDTKNMGFLFFFYGLYKPYASLFSHMAYFIAYMNAILIVFYYGLSLMIYELARRLNASINPLSALFGSVVFILYFTLVGNNLNFNQPQYALFTWLLLALYLVWRKKYKTWDYFIIGILLGVNFAGNSPSILLTLIVPFLLWQKNIKPKGYFSELFFKGGASFLGFLISLLPYFLYFYKNQALAGWWIWQVELSSTYSPKSWSGLLANIPIYGAAWSGGSKFTRVLSSVPLAAAGCYLLYFLKSHFKIPAVVALSILLGLSRLIFLSRGYIWYVLYYLPFIVLMLVYAADEVSQKPKKIVFTLFWVIWAMAALLNPVGWGVWNYDSRSAYITMNNLDKRPEVYVSARPVGFTYATKWKYVYYNIFRYPDEKSTEYRDSDRTIAQILPEVCILGSLGWGPSPSSEKEKYPILFQKYTEVSESMYIRNDKVGEWKLPPLDEKDLDNNQSFVSLWRLLTFRKTIPVLLYPYGASDTQSSD